MNRTHDKRSRGQGPDRAAVGASAALAFGLAACPAANAAQPAAWSQPIAPFRITDRIYYVGTQGLAAYLITSLQGDVLLDGTLEQNAPLIERNIESLGVRLHQVKILLNSHAHFDHAGGLARLKRDTGAVLLASAGDRWSLEHGRHFGDTTYGVGRFPPVAVDRAVADRETVRLGDLVLTARLTPGHTRGCTTWTLPQTSHGRTLRVVFPCSISVAGNVLVGNRAYPQIASDFRSSFGLLGALPADIVLPAHPEAADVLGRHQRQAAGDANAFVDPHALQQLVATARTDFEVEYAKEAHRR